jgi:hypothetical protein
VRRELVKDDEIGVGPAADGRIVFPSLSSMNSWSFPEKATARANAMACDLILKPSRNSPRGSRSTVHKLPGPSAMRIKSLLIFDPIGVVGCSNRSPVSSINPMG